MPALKDVGVFACETLDQAIQRLEEVQPRLVILCHAFDQMRPFRLIHHVRGEAGIGQLPIVLVHTTASHLRESQLGQMHEAYMSLGVNAFFDLYEDAELRGEEKALQRFRASIIDRLVLGK